MLTKVSRAAEMLASIAKLPFTDSRIPDAETALAVLQKIWPDTGKTCYLEQAVQRERTIPLSIIIPTYNNEQYLCGCIDSVLSQQTDIPFEVIVINDGSTDGTKALLERTYPSEPRLRIVHQENKGFSGARNAGIDIAQGEYLMFVDSDDRLLPGAVEDLMGVALEKNASVVCGGHNCLFPDGKVTVGQLLADEKISPMGRLEGYAWGKVYKASLFDHLRFPEGYWFEDSICAQIIWPLCENSCYTIRTCVYEYLMNPKGISAQAVRKPKAMDSLWLYRRLLEERKFFGLTITQADYEHFLEMVRLTYSRTRGFDEHARKSIFAMQIQLKQQYFAGFNSSEDSVNRTVEKALVKESYKLYALMGELPS